MNTIYSLPAAASDRDSKQSPEQASKPALQSSKICILTQEAVALTNLDTAPAVAFDRENLIPCTSCGCKGDGSCGRMIDTRDGSVWPSREAFRFAATAVSSEPANFSLKACWIEIAKKRQARPAEVQRRRRSKTPECSRIDGFDESSILGALVSANRKFFGHRRGFTVLAVPSILSAGKGKKKTKSKCVHGVHVNAANGKAEWCEVCFDSPHLARTAWHWQFSGAFRKAKPITRCHFGRYCGTCTLTLGLSIENIPDERPNRQRRKKQNDRPPSFSASGPAVPCPKERGSWPPVEVEEALTWARRLINMHVPTVKHGDNEDSIFVERGTSRRRETRVYCRNCGEMKWVLQEDNGTFLLECGCQRGLDLGTAATAPALSDDAKSGMRKLGYGLEKLETSRDIGKLEDEDGRVPNDGEAVRKNELPTDPSTWDNGMFGDGDVDDSYAERTGPRRLLKRPNQLIENCDGLDAEYVPRSEDPKNPPRYTVEDIEELERKRRIKLTPADKALLLLAANRLPSQPRPREISDREIAVLLLRTRGWKRYHLEKLEKIFFQGDPQGNQRLIDNYTKLYKNIHSQNVQVGSLYEGVQVDTDTLEWRSLIDACIKCGVSPNQFEQILETFRREVFIAIFSTLAGLPLPPSCLGILTAEQRLMIVDAARRPRAVTR